MHILFRKFSHCSYYFEILSDSKALSLSFKKKKKKKEKEKKKRLFLHKKRRFLLAQRNITNNLAATISLGPYG